MLDGGSNPCRNFNDSLVTGLQAMELVSDYIT